jgi:hypothetical protein
MESQAQIDQRTQEIVKLQIGDLVLTCASLRATNDALRAENASLKAPAPEPPRDAD